MALAVLAGSGGFLWFVERGAAPAPGGPPTAGIAVLTGGADRLEAGLALLAAWPEARLIVSGVAPDLGAAELFRIARGPVPEAGPLLPRLALGHEATSTRGNAREVAAWARGAGIREITVVTAGFHMPRAMLELRRALPEAALRPHPVEPLTARPLPMVREYAKLVGAALGVSALTERPPGGRALVERGRSGAGQPRAVGREAGASGGEGRDRAMQEGPGQDGSVQDGPVQDGPGRDRPLPEDLSGAIRAEQVVAGPGDARPADDRAADGQGEREAR
jgi:uncharacterized SAM-binding protein YcdF (DUF218 family)